MKIVTYQMTSNLENLTRLGILLDQKTILDPNLVMRLYYQDKNHRNGTERANYTLPSSLARLMQVSENPIEKLQECLQLYIDYQKKGKNQTHDGFSLTQTLDEKNILLKRPLDKIGTYRDFYTHEKHVQTGFKKRNEPMPEAWYEIPAYYKGATAGFIGPNDEILWPSFTDKLDYELELAIILSRDGKNIKSSSANQYIFGFTILNDVSARDIQRKEMSIRLGPSKGKDFCSVIGPVIVTFDEFNFTEPDLLMTAKINGTEWSRGQSGDSHYSFAEMIEFASRDEWLMATDLIGSGTVGTGCGLELDQWIKEGDIVELEIEKIGVLKNKVGKKIRPL